MAASWAGNPTAAGLFPGSWGSHSRGECSYPPRPPQSSAVAGAGRTPELPPLFPQGADCIRTHPGGPIQVSPPPKPSVYSPALALLPPLTPLLPPPPPPQCAEGPQGEKGQRGEVVSDARWMGPWHGDTAVCVSPPATSHVYPRLGRGGPAPRGQLSGWWWDEGSGGASRREALHEPTRGHPLCPAVPTQGLPGTAGTDGQKVSPACLWILALQREQLPRGSQDGSKSAGSCRCQPG